MYILIYITDSLKWGKYMKTSGNELFPLMQKDPSQIDEEINIKIERFTHLTNVIKHI